MCISVHIDTFLALCTNKVVLRQLHWTTRMFLASLHYGYFFSLLDLHWNQLSCALALSQNTLVLWALALVLCCRMVGACSAMSLILGRAPPNSATSGRCMILHRSHVLSRVSCAHPISGWDAPMPYVNTPNIPNYRGMLFYVLSHQISGRRSIQKHSCCPFDDRQLVWVCHGHPNTPAAHVGWLSHRVLLSES